MMMTNPNGHTLEQENRLLRARIAALEHTIQNLQTKLGDRSSDVEALPLALTSALFEQFSIPLIMYHPDGHVVGINRQYETLLRMTRDHDIEQINILNNHEYQEHGDTRAFQSALEGITTHVPPSPSSWLPGWRERTYIPLIDETGVVHAVVEMNSDKSNDIQDHDDLSMLTLLAEHIPDGIAITTIDGTIIYSNPALQTMVCQDKSLVNLSITNILAEGHDTITTILSSTVKCGAWHGTITYQHQPRHCLHGHLSTIIIQTPHTQSTVVAWILRNITQNIQLEEALRQSQTLLHAVLNNSPAAIYVRNTHGQLLLANDHFLALARATEQYESDRDPNHHSPNDLPDTILKTWFVDEHQIIATGQPIEREHTLMIGPRRYTYLDKQFPLFDNNGHVYAVGGIATDITGRKQTEEILRKAYAELKGQVQERTDELSEIYSALIAEIREHKWTEGLLFQREAMNRTILDAMPALIAYVDRHLRYQFVNKQYEIWFGYTRDDLLGKHIADVVGIEAYQNAQEHVQTVLSGMPVTHEFTMSTRLRSMCFARSSYIPHINAEQQVVGFFVMIHDLTEQKQTEEALRQSEARHRAISELITDFAYAIRVRADGGLTCEWVTDSVMRILGYRPEDLEQKHGWRMLFHSADLPIIMQSYGRALAGKPTVSEFRVLTHEGKTRWLRNHIQPIWSDTANRVVFVYGAAQDITERKHAEDQLQRQLQRLSALRQIDMAVTTSFDLRLVLNVLLHQITTQLEIDAAAVLLLNPQTQMLEYQADRGIHSRTVEQITVHTSDISPGHIAPSVQNGTLPSLNRDALLAEEGFCVYYNIPLMAKGQIKGLLELFHRSPFTPDQEWLNFLGTMARQAAIAVSNAELFESLQQSKEELIRAYDDTIEGWARALEMRDAETEGHSRRVTDMTIILAQAMGFRDADLIHIRRGAILHDIGKMAIPDTILLKPGPLTDEEMQLMRQHPVYAYKWLAPITYLTPALDIPYYHHEKWDGTGYPRGLKGEQIPLAARIFAVVDVWDALRSDRPYRKGWPEERVYAYLRDLAGSHFDPRVVDVFLSICINNSSTPPHSSS